MFIGINFQEPIFQDSVFEEAQVHLGLQQSGTSEVSVLKVDTYKNGSSQVTTSQIATSQVGATKIDPLQVSISQIGSLQISNAKDSIGQVGSSQVGITQIGVDHFNLTQVSSSEINATEVNVFYELNSTQINPTEISLPGSISLQQLLSSHNFSLQNTTVPTWLEFLQGTTPFNLNIEIADLPTVVAWVEARNPKSSLKMVLSESLWGMGFVPTSPMHHNKD